MILIIMWNFLKSLRYETMIPKSISLFLLFQIGTYTIALCAKMLNKPVYVMCESFKFVRLYPLNQQDLPNEFKVNIFDL